MIAKWSKDQDPLNFLGLSMACILESRKTLVHFYSRNKSDKQDCLFIVIVFNSIFPLNSSFLAGKIRLQNKVEQMKTEV